MTDGNLEVITGHQLNLLSSESNKSVRTSTENVINIIIIIDQSPTILHIRFTLHTDTWHVRLHTDTWKKKYLYDLISSAGGSQTPQVVLLVNTQDLR